MRLPGKLSLVGLAATCLATLFAATASAQPDPPPYILPAAPGVTPGAFWDPGSSSPGAFYTASDGTVWSGPSDSLAIPVYPLGRLIGAPAPLSISAGIFWIFGRGTDNHLWYQKSIPEYTSPWYPLGGPLSSKPGVASLGGNAYAVFVRGTDGAVWERVHTSSNWDAWQRIGGQVLAGTGPTAAYLTGSGQLYVAVVGTNHQIYLKVANGSGGFFSIGGQSTANPALAAISSTTLAAFCRGTDNAGYYTRYTAAGGAASWRSMGGKLTSGLSTAVGTVNGEVTTGTFALGTNSSIFTNSGIWASYPPSFSGWKDY